jgi:hypothetical protein
VLRLPDPTLDACPECGANVIRTGRNPRNESTGLPVAVQVEVCSSCKTVLLRREGEPWRITG